MARSVPFDRIAERYEETRGGLERGEHFAVSIDAQLPAGATVLEIGVGTGAVALGLVGLGHDVIGLDLSRPMLTKAVERLPGRLVLGDAAVLPLGDAVVDAVVAVWTVHLVGDVDAMADEVRRVLRPGGRWFVVSPNADWDPVDVLDLAYSFGPALGRGWDRSESLAPRLATRRVRHLGDTATDEHRFEETPNQRADSIERRDWSSLWDLDDVAWNQHVQPVVDALRALPEPDRRRPCVHRYVLSTYQPMA